MIYLQLGQADLAKTLDIKGRNKAVAANLLPILTIIGCVAYWIIAQDFRVVSILLGVLLPLVSLGLGVHLQTSAIIESVYRGKDGKNKKIYLKHKAYFDKKFKRLDHSDRPFIKRHIIEQRGGDNDDRRH